MRKALTGLVIVFGVSTVSAADLTSSVVPLSAGVVVEAERLDEGLFPDVRCDELIANGFKCMGFRPPVRYTLPTIHFEVGSAEVPSELMQQLDVFASVLSSRLTERSRVEIVGHADASGEAEFNQSLSLARASAVKAYLVDRGVNAEFLATNGYGESRPIDPADPFAAENRRVEIGRVGFGR